MSRSIACGFPSICQFRDFKLFSIRLFNYLSFVTSCIALLCQQHTKYCHCIDVHLNAIISEPMLFQSPILFFSLSLPLPLISYNSFPADWFSFTFIRQWAWTRAPHHSFQPHIAISLAVTRLFKLKEEKTRTMRFNLRHQSRLIQKEIHSSYIVAIAIACWATLIGKLQIPVKHSIESVHFGFYLVAKEY